GAVLNFLIPDAFEVALEAAAIGVVFTWGTIFACQLRLRKLVNKGVIPRSPFQAPGYPWTSYIGLAFLALVIVGLAGGETQGGGEHRWADQGGVVGHRTDLRRSGPGRPRPRQERR